MGITLADNSNTILNSYLKGWEKALKIFEEETSRRKTRGRGNNFKKKN